MLVAEKAVAALLQLLIALVAPRLHLVALRYLNQCELLKLRVRVQSFDFKEFDFKSEVRVWRNQAAGSSIAVRVV